MKRKIISIFMIIIILLNICSFVFAEDSTNTVTNQTLDQRKIDKLVKIMKNKDVLNDVEKMI